MVRATRQPTRSRLVELLLEADQPCLRLFLDYQGLRILAHWMFDLDNSLQHLQLKLSIEAVLSRWGRLTSPHIISPHLT